MLEQHDADVLPRCRRLGHEITFAYCRRENFGKPCRLILDCWWERFDVYRLPMATSSMNTGGGRGARAIGDNLRIAGRRTFW
jgi:hypothetical protein